MRIPFYFSTDLLCVRYILLALCNYTVHIKSFLSCFHPQIMPNTLLLLQPIM